MYSKTISINLESILTDHQGFIQTINWHPTNTDEFLTSGSDKNVIRWKYSAEECLWLPISRMGDAGEEHVDYFDAIYSPDGNSIIYHSLFGAFYIWKINGEVNCSFLHPFLIIYC
jgi:WD40 repeat protein